MEAQSLIAKDNMMGGMVKGKSDPYAKIRIGEFEIKSHVIKENLNPVWNEMYEVCTEASWSKRSPAGGTNDNKDHDLFLSIIFVNS